MVEPYSNREYVDMIKVLGACNDNTRAAARLYRENYPNRRHPDHKTIQNAELRMVETGFVAPKRNDAGRPPALTWQQEELLEIIENDPTTSTRILTRHGQNSRSTIHRFIQRENLYPYHFQPVQILQRVDRELRLNFCRWALQQTEMIPNFFERILWTDEAHFNQTGVFNFHNLHYWAQENPHRVRIRNRQYRWSVNVWIGQLGNRLIGPHFLPRILNGAIYLDFCDNTLPLLLEDVPIAERQNMFFQHDGAPAHTTLLVREMLNRRFPNKWIGRGGPVLWPPRSPDLNPIDFWLWGYLKDKVYFTEPDGEDDVIVRLYGALAEITEETVHAVQTNFLNRLRLCIVQNGDIFEHLLR